MSINFALRIIELRDKYQLTQAELAKKLDISTSTVAMWETDNRIPPALMLQKLADYFDVSVDYLLGRDEKKEAQPDRAAPLYSAEEKKLIEIYKRCPKETQMVIMNLMNGLAAELDTKNINNNLD